MTGDRTARGPRASRFSSPFSLRGCLLALLLALELTRHISAGMAGEAPGGEVSALPSPRYVLGSSVNLRESRDEGSHIAGSLRIGTRVSVLETYRELARVRTESGDEGWMTAGLLTDTLPTVEDCLSRARATPKPSQALVWNLRAYGLAPWDRKVIQALEAAYRAAGEVEKADEMARKADYAGPLWLGTCAMGACDVWLELTNGHFQAYASNKDARSGARVSPRVRELEGWLYLQADLAEGWLTPSTGAWKRVHGRERLEDAAIAEGLIISRLTRPVQPEYQVPSSSALRGRVADVLLESSPRADWLRYSRTGPTPGAIKVWPVTSAQEEPTVAIEVRFDVTPMDGRSRPGRYRGVMIARVRLDGTLEVLAREGLLEPSQTGALRSARLRGAADLDGDGRAEVLVTAGVGPEERLETTDRLWRGRVEADHVVWKGEVSATSGPGGSSP